MQATLATVAQPATRPATLPEPLETGLKNRMTQDELAAYWGISAKTLERWRSIGIGPVFMRLPGKVVYRREDVEAFERKSLRKSTDEAVWAGGAV